MTTESKKRIHHGRNIRRFRELMGYKQEALASALGQDWNQRKISLLESKEIVEPELLNEVARVLKVPVQAIENFDEESTVLNIQNNHDHAAPSINFPSQCTFNLLDKFLEMVEKNEKLYQQLLESEREKNALLQKVLDEKS
jgi:transcriptional regulator with XRE-family HTH domain